MSRIEQAMRPATDAERKALGVPPAYTDVMVAVDPKADLRATARIPATPRHPDGKTFYLYSKGFRAKQDAKKWKRVQKLEAKMERVAERIDRDAEAGDGLAICARLVVLTGMRNGGDPQGAKVSYGASSLLVKHVVENDGQSIRLVFPGKHAVEQDV